MERLEMAMFVAVFILTLVSVVTFALDVRYVKSRKFRQWSEQIKFYKIAKSVVETNPKRPILSLINVRIPSVLTIAIGVTYMVTNIS